MRTPNPTPDKAYMNSKEAAQYLGVSDRTVRSLCKTRKLTHELLNNRNIRIKKQWLDDYLDSIRVEAETMEVRDYEHPAQHEH